MGTGMQLTRTRQQSVSQRDLRQRTECTPQHNLSLLPPYLDLQPYTVVHPNLCYPKTTRYSARVISGIQEKIEDDAR